MSSLVNPKFGFLITKSSYSTQISSYSLSDIIGHHSHDIICYDVLFDFKK